MFSIDCPRHGCRVLLGSRSIEALVNTPDGIVLHWRCRCGATGVEHLGVSGNRQQPAPQPALDAAA